MEKTYTEKLAAAVGLTCFALVMLLFVWFARDVLLLAFSGVLFAIFLRGLSDFVTSKTGLPDRASLTLVVIVLIVASILVGVILAPSISQNIDTFVTDMPKAIQKMQDAVLRTAWGKRLLGNTLAGSEEQSKQMVVAATGLVSHSVEGLAGIVFVIFTGLFLAVEPGLYVSGLLRLAPPERRQRYKLILNEMGVALSHWLLAQIFLMVVLGFTLTLGLWALGVPMAAVLGTFSGILLFVPYLGAVASAIPAIMLALLKSTQLAIWVIIVFTALHIVEGYLLTPIVQRKAVELPPFLILFFQALFGAVAGVMGVALSTPILAAIMVLVQRLYVEDTLGDVESRPSTIA